MTSGSEYGGKRKQIRKHKTANIKTVSDMGLMEIHVHVYAKVLAMHIKYKKYQYLIYACHQVLLHERAEVPEMASLGFAIAPGTRTLVGISRKEVGSTIVYTRSYC